MSCNKGGNFVCGLFLGAVIGASVGMLTAPESGENTRKRIKKDTEDAFGSVYDQAAEYGETLKQQVQEMTDGMTEKVNQYKMQIENKIQEIQDEVNQDIADLNEELEKLHEEEEAQAQNAAVEAEQAAAKE
ncbi:MAG: YtxH domain-containing protein [Eubacteriaceae bacterium]